MKARYIGDRGGDFYGLHLIRGAVLDIPPEIEWRVKRLPMIFEIIPEVRRGRPPKVRDGDEG